jgi:arylsulfatase A-like enzyme
MVEQPKPPSLNPLPAREAVRLAAASSLSLALSLGFCDLIASILRDHPRAFQSLAAVLPPLSMSIPAFVLLFLPIFLVAALLPGRALQVRKGPILMALATSLGTCLVLILYFNLVNPHPTAMQFRLLTLTAFLALALGVLRYFMLRRSWEGPGVPAEITATLLSLPLIMGTGFLFIRAQDFRTAPGSGSRALLWNLIAVATLAAGGLVSIFLSRRIHVERWLGAAAALLVVSGLASILLGGAGPKASPDSGVKSRAVRRILFLSIDTLRADAVSALNPSAPPTPNLDSLAADSVVFTRAYSPAPWTLPTFSTMMTGVTPLVHGVRKFEDRIPQALPTLAERMSQAGYLTAAIGDQLFLHPQHGISRGFQSYEISPRDEYGGSVGSRILGWAFPARFKRALDTTEITDLAVSWLKQHAHDDFFLWLHYFKPHGPYEPLPQYRPKEEPPAGMGYKFSSDNAIRAGSLVITAEQRPWVRELYEGELRYVDDNVGRVLAELKRLGIYDDMLIVFVSDHGEEFWDHDARAHGHTFYDELLRVPLIIKLPGAGLREKRDELVCTGSLFPTLLDFAAIPREEGSISYAPLTPLLGGAGAPYQEVPVLSAVPLYFEDRESIVFGDTKYIVSLVTNREQLYDLKNDPREQRNLATEPSDTLLQARQALEAARQSSDTLRKRYGIREEAAAPLSPETLEQLRSLGYVR